jgi:hypothetical protein
MADLMSGSGEAVVDLLCGLFSSTLIKKKIKFSSYMRKIHD